MFDVCVCMRTCAVTFVLDVEAEEEHVAYLGHVHGFVVSACGAVHGHVHLKL